MKAFVYVQFDMIGEGNTEEEVKIDALKKIIAALQKDGIALLEIDEYVEPLGE